MNVGKYCLYLINKYLFISIGNHVPTGANGDPRVLQTVRKMTMFDYLTSFVQAAANSVTTAQNERKDLLWYQL